MLKKENEMSKTILCDGLCHGITAKGKVIYEIDTSVQLLTELHYKKKNIKHLCEECVESLNNETLLKWRLKPILTLDKEED